MSEEPSVRESDGNSYVACEDSSHQDRRHAKRTSSELKIQSYLDRVGDENREMCMLKAMNQINEPLNYGKSC